MEEDALSYDLNVHLIQLVRKHNNLFDKSSKDYKDNFKRKESWGQIVSQFNASTGCNVTVKEVINQWKQLKARYVKERSVLRKYIPSGSQRGPEPKLWPYYYDMDFLAQKISQRKTVSNFNIHNKDVEELSPDESSDEEFHVNNQSDSDDSANIEESIFHHFSIEESEIIGNKSTTIEAEKSPIKAIDQSLLNEHLLVLRDAWQTVPEKNRKDCYVALRKLILKKKSSE